MKAIGIDLGTTNTVVAAKVGDVARTLRDEQGEYLLPSVVSFHPSGDVLVGRPARERLPVDPANTVASVKRLLGRPFGSPEVQANLGSFPFKLVGGPRDVTMVEVRGSTYALPEVSAFILRRARDLAEAALGDKVAHAVITVPANFNDLQRASTKMAARLAGLEVLRILNEPTAAALAYGQTSTKSQRIAVFDLGGGTFDITLLDVSGSVLEVVATGGDSALGGDDLDAAIAERLSHDFLRTHRFDPRADPASFGKLKLHAERLKRALTTDERATVHVDDVGFGPGGRVLELDVSLGRDELEALAEPFVRRALEVTASTLATAGLLPGSIDRVLLVGGSTRTPLVARRVGEYFGREPKGGLGPDEAVALGAAIQADVLGRSRRKKEAPVSSPLAAPLAVTGTQRLQAFSAPPAAGASMPGVRPPSPSFTSETSGARPPPPVPPARKPMPSFSGAPPPVPSGRPATSPSLDPLLRTAQMPAFSPPSDAPSALRKTAPSLTFELDDEPRPPPRTSVPSGSDLAAELAQGRAVRTQAASTLLIDVTPLSLRVETVAGYSDVVVPAGSPVPCDRARIFSTASDGQSTVTVRVAQGEAVAFAQNTYLGEVVLEGLRPAVRGEVQVQITFGIDPDGILEVRAVDVETRKETKTQLRLLGQMDEAGR